MKHMKCERCGNQFPMGELVVVSGQPVCHPCMDEARARGRGPGVQDTVTRMTDPTICTNCGMDAGRVELPLLAGLPTCDKCINGFRRRPFPLWIKVAMAGLAALAVFALVRNLRFFQGQVEARRADRAWAAGNVEEAAYQMQAAANHVPEVRGFQDEALYFRGIYFLSQDMNADAAETLRALQQRVGHAKGLDHYLAVAEANAAFDNKDYDTFLAKARAQAELDPKNADCIATLASAWACKYAATGDEAAKKEALGWLDKAKELAPADDDGFGDYEARILYRIQTREIITAEEYHRRLSEGLGKAAP
jgi:tetratricopeptide (TPR) repeat protein